MHPTNKKEENIAEYILLMYQIEEVVRLLSFDESSVLSLFTGDEKSEDSQMKQARSFYLNVIDEMRQQGLEKNGHLEELKEIVLELIYLHNTLITLMNDEKYKGLCEAAFDDVQAFRIKSTLEKNHEVEVILHAMFMKMQLKLRKQEISAETELSMDRMRVQLAYLSRAYKKMKSGDLNFIQN
jgi:hypothetical protein